MTDQSARLALALSVLLLGAPASAAPGQGGLDSGGSVRPADQSAPTDPGVAPLEGRTAAAAAAPRRRARTTPSLSGRASTDELLQVAGLDRQLSAFGARLAEQLASGTSGLSPADRQTAARVLHAGLDGEGLSRVIRAELARQQEPAQMQAVVAWYRGPIGARVAAAAAALETPDGQRQFAAFVAQQPSAPASPARQALVEQLEWLGGDADTSAEIVLAAMRAMALTLNAALPAERRQRPGVLERRLEEAQRPLAASLRGPILRSIQFVYRDLSDDEVRRSTEFHSSQAARWFTAAVKQAFTRAAREAAERSARELVRAIPPERWQGPAGPSQGR